MDEWTKWFKELEGFELEEILSCLKDAFKRKHRQL